ncbi:PH domain-containing protein [Georgenia satyanarayanai]|uniref:PH domain-containing protein n=1 Tax=Georgenia satyanarayanai TaxID=860221 RepID=UPI0011B7AF2C|nr:PH domain-containing protein [Georgenia satyanarayanai]
MDRRVEWRVSSRKQLRVQQIGFVVLLLLFTWTLTCDDVASFPRVAYLLLVLIPAMNIVAGRARTVADVDGVEVCGGVRTRHVPWSAVDEVRAVHSEWTDPKVEMHLTDGSSRTLPCIPTDAVPQLEELRAAAHE